MIEREFEGEMRENRGKSGLGMSEKIREKLKSLLFDEKTKIRNNKHSLIEEVSKLQELGFWLMS